jgi:hypothetical protein
MPTSEQRRLRPPRQLAGDMHIQRAVQGQRAERSHQATVGQNGRVDAADQITKLGQRLGRGGAGLGQ